MRLIYDTLIFCDEVELLKLRFTELWDVVDKFVIVEARENHRGKPKPLHYTDSLEFEPWKEKVHCFIINSYDGCIGDCKLANMRREHLGRELLGTYPYEPNSTIVFSDADEICKAEVVRAHRRTTRVVAVQMMFTHYFFNCLHCDPPTKRSAIGPLVAYQKHGFDNVRWHLTDTAPVILDGGWHHSYLGGLQALKDKINCAVEGCSSDWVFSEPPELIQGRIDAGQLYNGAKQFSFIPVDDRLSKYVRDNQERLTAMGLIKPIGVAA